MPEDDWRRRTRTSANRGSSATSPRPSASRRMAERLGTSAGAVAIAWTLRNPAVDGAIVGVRHPGQVDELLAGAALELDEELAT